MFKNNMDCKLFDYKSDEIRFRKYYIGTNEEVGIGLYITHLILLCLGLGEMLTEFWRGNLLSRRPRCEKKKKDKAIPVTGREGP
jgi:hypothetical protein